MSWLDTLVDRLRDRFYRWVYQEWYALWNVHSSAGTIVEKSERTEEVVAILRSPQGERRIRNG